MEIVFLVAGLIVGGVLGWLWANSRALRQTQAEREQRIAAETRQQETEKQLAAQVALLDEAKRQLGDTFKALSSDALQRNSQAFVESAKLTLGPLQDALKRYEDHLREVESARRESYGGLEAQTRSLLESEQQLQRETSNLVNALRRPQVRGRWGELTLHRTVELAGMVQHVDFAEQVTVSGDAGRLRPDMIVNLPNGRQVVVDVKVSLDAYLSALEAPDEEQRKTCLARHCQQLRQHMSSLASKSYWEQFTAAPDFVVMFVPGEVFLSEAAALDPALLEDGAKSNVILATPTILIALLRTIASGWREERIAKSAQQVSDLGRQLYDRTRAFVGHLANLGKRLAGATDAFNAAVGSLERNVLPAARRFRELGAGTGAEIPELEPLDGHVRELIAPEAPDEDS